MCERAVRRGMSCCASAHAAIQDKTLNRQISQCRSVEFCTENLSDKSGQSPETDWVTNRVLHTCQSSFNVQDLPYLLVQIMGKTKHRCNGQSLSSSGRLLWKGKVGNCLSPLFKALARAFSRNHLLSVQNRDILRSLIGFSMRISCSMLTFCN